MGDETICGHKMKARVSLESLWSLSKGMDRIQRFNTAVAYSKAILLTVKWREAEDELGRRSLRPASNVETSNLTLSRSLRCRSSPLHAHLVRRGQAYEQWPSPKSRFSVDETDKVSDNRDCFGILVSLHFGRGHNGLHDVGREVPAA
jgi:hypothetical protein